MGMVGILVGSGWLLRELGVLFGPEPQEKPRRSAGLFLCWFSHVFYL